MSTSTSTPGTSAIGSLERHFANLALSQVDHTQFYTLSERFLNEGSQELLAKILSSISISGAFHTCRYWRTCTESPHFYSAVLENLLKDPLGNRLFENELATSSPATSDKEWVQRIFQQLSSYFSAVVPSQNEPKDLRAHLHDLSPHADSKSCCYTISELLELKASLLALAALPKVKEASDIEPIRNNSRYYFEEKIIAPLLKPSHKKGAPDERFGIIQHPYLFNRSVALYHLLKSKMETGEYPTYLSLRNIQLIHFCEPLSSMTKVQMLDVSKNLLMALPTTFTQLAELQSLKLSDNNFFHFPTCVYQLPKLQNLQAQNIRIHILPTGIKALSFLRLLDLSHNNLATLPEELSQNTSLEVLLLSHNRLTSLPSIADLPKLRILDVSYNRLSYCPQPNSNLKVLLIANNLLSHNNPQRVDPFLAFENLDFLYLANNPLFQETIELKNLAHSHPIIHQTHRGNPHLHCPKEDISPRLHMKNITCLILRVIENEVIKNEEAIPEPHVQLLSMRRCNIIRPKACTLPSKPL